jgi:hypothetical protein
MPNLLMLHSKFDEKAPFNHENEKIHPLQAYYTKNEKIHPSTAKDSFIIYFY